MSSRLELTEAERHYAIGCLRASAASNEGQPKWAEVQKLTGRDPKVLKRLWVQAGQMSDPAPVAGEVGVDAPPNPGGQSEADYWSFAWRQLQAELKRAESDVARLGLLKRQDDVYFKLRSALAEEGNADVTPEEGAARIMQLVDAMPDGLLMQVAAVVRRRGIIT